MLCTRARAFRNMWSLDLELIKSMICINLHVVVRDRESKKGNVTSYPATIYRPYVTATRGECH